MSCSVTILRRQAGVSIAEPHHPRGCECRGSAGMNRVFSITVPFRVPDGTWVSPFLNAKDSQSDLPFELLDGFSLAAGTIDPNSCSKIQLMPFDTQVTFVRSGNLAVRMKVRTTQGPTFCA